MPEKHFTDEDRRLVAELLTPKDRAPTQAEVDLFVRQCERTQLDPFDRQIYASFRWDRNSGRDRMSVQATIDGFRLVAERSGNYLGQDGPYWCGEDRQWFDVWIDEKVKPVAAKVGVWKRDAPAPTYAVAKFSEYAQKGRNGQLIGLWPTMPSNQLAKCAEALALRKAFPDKLSGIYTADEMAQADNPVDAEASDITNAPALPAAKPVAGNGQPPEPPTPPKRAAADPATEGEIEALRELIKVTETGDPWVRMELINFGIEDVGPVDEMLPKLTVGQAVHLMNAINARMAA